MIKSPSCCPAKSDTARKSTCPGATGGGSISWRFPEGTSPSEPWGSSRHLHHSLSTLDTTSTKSSRDTHSSPGVVVRKSRRTLATLSDAILSASIFFCERNTNLFMPSRLFFNLFYSLKNIVSVLGIISKKNLILILAFLQNTRKIENSLLLSRQDKCYSNCEWESKAASSGFWASHFCT